jgi:hypothetical protein
VPNLLGYFFLLFLKNIGLNAFSPTYAMPALTGSLSTKPLYMATSWQSDRPENVGAGRKAAQYLNVIRDLAVNPYWIGLSDTGADCSFALEWIEIHIGAVNRELGHILQEGLNCFHANQRPDIQIFAAPILSRAGVDGFCNLGVQPITLIVDPSRVVRPDWPKLVIHELAHGIARSAGHGDLFSSALTHLCLAFDLPEPPAGSDELLRTWPPYSVNTNQANFWHIK